MTTPATAVPPLPAAAPTRSGTDSSDKKVDVTYVFHSAPRSTSDDEDVSDVCPDAPVLPTPDEIMVVVPPAPEAKTLYLESSEGKKFIVEKDAIEMSLTIKNMLEDVGETDIVIPVPSVANRALARIIEFCTHHHVHPSVATGGSSDNGARTPYSFDPWDKAFLPTACDEIFELITAANYMNIKPLLEAACHLVADMIKGKTPEDIRKLFDIKNDFTPEEEEQIRKENEWCQDR